MPKEENKGQCLFEARESYVVLDIETTGLNPRRNEIIEIGAVKVENARITDEFSRLVKPKGSISSFVTELTGITNAMVAGAPGIDRVMPKFVNFIGDHVILGHNISFDMGFLNRAAMETLGRDFDYDYMDTLKISRRIFPEEHHHRLCDLELRFGLHNESAHRALNDVLLTYQCYEYMKQYIADKNISWADLQSQKRDHLRAEDIAPETADFDKTAPTYGKIFVFTGALVSMLRRDAMQRVVNAGGRAEDQVHEKTDYLVMGKRETDGKSAKQKRAESLIQKGCPIQMLDEAQFLKMLQAKAE